VHAYFGSFTFSLIKLAACKCLSVFGLCLPEKSPDDMYVLEGRERQQHYYCGGAGAFVRHMPVAVGAEGSTCV